MIRIILEIIAHPERDCIYSIHGHLQLSLFVDIGAAAGHDTRRICHIGGDHTKVYAYEPFPSNHYYFRRNTEELTNDITLIKKAVSNRTVKSEFFVGSVLSGVEPGWQSYNGYSSVGYLTSASEANNSTLNSNSFKLLKLNSYLKPKIRGLLDTFLDLPYPKIFNVKTTTQDTEFPIENIDLIKIDVQGAEVDVLHGAKNYAAGKKG